MAGAFLCLLYRRGLLYMSKLIALRLPDDLYESTQRLAKAEGMNLSQAIISLLRDDGTPIPQGEKLAAKPAVRAKVEKPRATSQPEPKPPPVEAKPAYGDWNKAAIYQKPAHAENCSCYACRPPK